MPMAALVDAEGLPLSWTTERALSLPDLPEKGKERSPSEWVIVTNAHPAIITEDEAKPIARLRRSLSAGAQFSSSRARRCRSPYLLS